MITVYQACTSGNTDVVLRNIRRLSIDGFGNTLHIACLAGKTEVARMLIRAGASLEDHDEEGMKPIHRACQGGSLETVKLLIELGANRVDIDDDHIIAHLLDE